jgi:plasmid stability protein
MKTTIELPDELVRQIKLKAVVDGRKLKDTIAALLRAGLASETSHSMPVMSQEKRKFPIVKCRRAARRKDELTPERVAEILTRQEAAWHAETRR